MSLAALFGGLGSLYGGYQQQSAAQQAAQGLQNHYSSLYANQLQNMAGMGMGQGGPMRAKPRPTKCDSCGSREFKQHAGQTVCAYCRGVA